MRVLIASPLRSYTKERVVEASGATLGELIADLDRRYPGIRFRIVDEQDNLRPHIRFFADGEKLTTLDAPLGGVDEVQMVQALSGG